MTITKTPPNPTFQALMTRLSLDDRQAAQYLGVPPFTFRKWLTGERVPNSAVLRLLEVLGIVEALAPALHSSLLPAPYPAKSGRGRKTKTDSVKTIDPV
jgi:hypothetical protein